MTSDYEQKAKAQYKARQAKFKQGFIDLAQEFAEGQITKEELEARVGSHVEALEKHGFCEAWHGHHNTGRFITLWDID